MKGDNVISFDESYMSLETLTKEYGWSKSGSAVIKRVNGRKYKEGRSMLLAISNNKEVAHELIKGPVNGDHIRKFIMEKVIKNKTGIKLL